MGLATDLFDYQLPTELIAQRPTEKRDGSRMLVLDRQSGDCSILPFGRIVDYLSPGDTLVFNDTKVMKARMYGRKNGRPEAARFELLLVAPLDTARRWNVLLKPGKRAAAGTVVVLTDHAGRINGQGDSFTVLSRCPDGSFNVEFNTDELERLQAVYGHIPLPPYIQRGDEKPDAERYQTIFARESGAVAAPTAGLHFTPEIMAELAAGAVRSAAVTLHVGPGTFKPVSVDDIARHHMHTDRFSLPETTADLINRTHAEGRKIMAVGTTSVRVLESCAAPDGTVTPRCGATDIFLYPPYHPRCVDMLLTNFHLPKSTLLMLVATFVDREKMLAAYELAIRERMRFYSYGDCMLLK